MAGLEDGDFLDDLVQANPVTATDPVTEGAAHLRLLKKVLQQTFPNYNEAVLLTPAQLNDAALKSVAQTISGVWQHNSNLNLLNNVSLQGQNSGATVNGALARMNSNNESEFGNATFPTRLQYFEELFVARSGVAIAQFTSGPGGGLLVTDTLGALSPVAKIGANEIVSGSWNFTVPVGLINETVIKSGGTNAQLLFNDAAEAPRWRIGTTGAPGEDFILWDERLANVIFQIDEADSSTRWIQKLTVRDLNSQDKKVGFRNPSGRVITGAITLLQSDEGQILQCNTGIVSITVDVLEIDTTITILNRTDDDVQLLAGSATLEWYSGSGSFEGGDRVLTGRSVVQVHYRDSTAVSLWGNGIS